MNNNLRIVTRKATINDVDMLIELRKLLLNEGVGHYVSKSHEEQIAWQESYRKWLFRNIHANEKIVVAVAHYDGESDISACAIGIIDERAPMKGCLNGLVGWVQSVIVHPARRRRGFAESLMKYILDWFKTNDVQKVVLQTTPIAKNLYTKLGFTDSGEELLLKEI
ncbi:N-acetyltransferase [Heyndrickxia faecalis]|jgi:ribosomal protein S18 acetylase RimI-like enzyme|uniref:GCN5 family acetyltransferase n=2 Tax=Parageobacillus TaxID=1906945 RepID=A0AAN0YRR1_PARTM|nr:MULTISPECIES: N-acetyltransferase [Parageobacillus]AEH49811.1 GCN5-related N-acetyltransferase [Parageobacillus thermoglucosidasius C56-YS93]ANZ32228.1 GCN5 family acetyltransferase [Parageobacillus thermoglucosidasius]APM82963.1 GNAT family N-acetyltransferase [Parageobacillus thermoglucosidasius]KJX67365.1 GCN5 family acetyltransferase [Parageobacillus thermoglucosidasius]MBY6269871.1 N-acetyltransferase [Parageobacillus thermoglucosidasius]